MKCVFISRTPKYSYCWLVLIILITVLYTKTTCIAFCSLIYLYVIFFFNVEFVSSCFVMYIQFFINASSNYWFCTLNRIKSKLIKKLCFYDSLKCNSYISKFKTLLQISSSTDWLSNLRSSFQDIKIILMGNEFRETLNLFLIV